jgi:hypothetical protein
MVDLVLEEMHEQAVWRGINDESGRMLKLLLLLVAAYAGFDLIRTLRTGRARIRITTVTQPARYRRYVYSGACIAACHSSASCSALGSLVM